MATSRHGIGVRNQERELEDPSTWQDGVNDWEKANASLQNPAEVGWDGRFGRPSSTEDAVYRLFATNFSSWESFETKQFHTGTASDYMSLEFVHDGIHVSLYITAKDPGSELTLHSR